MSDLNFLDTSGNKQTITVPAVNSMAFNTANTERLRIDGSGRIGVSHDLTGTSNYNRLMLHNPHDGSCWMQLTSTATGNSANTDGLSIGLNTSNVAHIWQRENAAMVFATNGTERLRISSSGAVTKPNHPSFRINRTVGNNYTSTTLNEILPFNVVEWDKTNVSGYGYDTSTYKYRVAVAGVYWFHCAVYTDTNIEVMFDIVKNSAGNYIQRAELRQSGSDDIGNNSIVHCAGLSQCAVGDYIYVVNSGGNAIELIGGNAEGYVDFSGYLIG